MNNPYLIEQLTLGSPAKISINKIGDKIFEGDYGNKKMIEFSMPNGTVVNHFIKDNYKNKWIFLEQEGTFVMATKKKFTNDKQEEIEFVDIVPCRDISVQPQNVVGAPAESSGTLPPTQPPNTPPTPLKMDEEAKWHKIAVSKIVHNFMRDYINLGKTQEEAGAEAHKAYLVQDRIVNEEIDAPRENNAVSQYESEVDVNSLPF